MLEQEALKFDVVVATSVLKAAALDAKTKFANPAISELANHCWEPSLAMVQGWFGRLDVLLQTWGRHLVWVATEHMAIITTELQKVIYSGLLALYSRSQDQRVYGEEAALGAEGAHSAQGEDRRTPPGDGAAPGLGK